MRTALWIGSGMVVAVALVMLGLVGGWALWGRPVWATGPYVAARAEMEAPGGCAGWGFGAGPGMMGRGGTASTAPCVYWDDDGEPADALTIEQAHGAVERYVAGLGYADLEIAEVMEFERNFYAIVEESDTGMGAMELLVDKWTGAVGPEPGPNMMWNARYGMHGRGGGMMGWATSEANAIPPEEALETAQRWLETYRPGVSVEEHVDPFYGYYTIHTLRDGEIEGMLSVHGTTGQVWYHTWHGAFIQMAEEDSH